MTRRQLALDIGLAAAIAVISQLEIWAPHVLLSPTHMTRPHAAVSAAYLLATLALLVRTRMPLVAVALICLPLCVAWIAVGAPESFGSFVLIVVAAYSVAANAAAHRAALGLVILLAAAATWTLADPKHSGVSDYLVGLAWLAPAAVVWLTGIFVHRHRLAEQRLARTAARSEREAKARAAVEDERARIARELHDAVGHSVSVMTLQASAVRRLLNPDQTRELEALRAVEETGREALAEMRRMVGVLRARDGAPALEPQPSLDQLPRLIEQVREAGLPVELRVEGKPAQLSAGLDLTAYRVVQEGLTNALKHARARQAEVVLRYQPGAVEVVVGDDGCGAIVGTESGHGLIGLRERVSLYGGQLSVGRSERGGFQLRARLLLSDA